MSNTQEQEQSEAEVTLSDEQWSALAESVGKAADDAVEDVVAALIAAVTTPSEDLVLADRANLEELQVLAEQGARWVAEKSRAEAEEIVSQAVNAGQINASHREKWVQRVVADRDDAVSILAQIPESARIPRAEIGHGLDPLTLETVEPTGWVR